LVPSPGCWSNDPTNIDNDVWFTFIAEGNSVAVAVTGDSDDDLPGGTLVNPEMAFYEGGCDNLSEIGCASDFDNVNGVEFIIPNLIVGARYYIRVGADATFTGTFRLCVESFNAVPEPSADCPSSVILCDKSSFVVEQLIGTGLTNDQLPISACNSATCAWGESNSSWYTWTCLDAGSLAFTFDVCFLVKTLERLLMNGSHALVQLVYHFLMEMVPRPADAKQVIIISSPL